MKDEGFVWQCKCGHIEHEDEPPEDCPKCLRIGKFSPVPEDQIEEKVEEAVLALNSGDYEDEE